MSSEPSARRRHAVHRAGPEHDRTTRAIGAGVTEVAIFAAASETFSQRNINQTIDESLAVYTEVAREAGTPLRCAAISRPLSGAHTKARCR